MNILLIDDASQIIKTVSRSLSEIDPDYEIDSYTDSNDFIDQNGLYKDYQVAFLDIELSGENGIALAKKLQKKNRRINIIFISGYPQYMIDAFEIYASGFLVKPFGKNDIKKALNNLRFPVENKKGKKMRVQCFGNFEVFSDNSPIHFYRSKSKELLAYLVDRRGAVCNADMIIGNLWLEENVTNKLKSLERMVVTDLFRSLADYGLEDIVFRDKAGLSLDVNRVDCDYYRYLVGEKLAVHQFRGEYMNQYVFAESTRAYLERKHYE